MIHLIAWTIWSYMAAGLARLAYRDWRDPEEDRAVVAASAGLCAAALAVAAVLIAVLT